MLQIAVIHPGSSEFDQQSRIQGKLNIPLSDRGSQEVAELVKELSNQGIDVLYVADSEPSLQTAETVCQSLGVKLKTLEGLHNVDHGLWEGMLVEEVKHKHPKIFRLWSEMVENVCPPEGETLGEARYRVSQFLKKIVKKHSQGLLALVMPQPLADLVVACLTEGDLGEDWQVDADYGKWEILNPRPKSLVGTGNEKKH